MNEYEFKNELQTRYLQLCDELIALRSKRVRNQHKFKAQLTSLNSQLTDIRLQLLAVNGQSMTAKRGGQRKVVNANVRVRGPNDR